MQQIPIEWEPELDGMGLLAGHMGLPEMLRSWMVLLTTAYGKYQFLRQQRSGVWR